MAYVYRHIRNDKNEPFYIGIGKADDLMYKRAYNKSNQHRSEAWHRIIAKTDYEVEILFDNVSIEFAKEKEKEFIQIHGRRDLGMGTLVNMTDGGDGCNNMVVTKETRSKLSASAKKREPQPQLQKIIEWRKNNRFFFTDEMRIKLSNSLKGRKLPNHQIEQLKKRVGENNPMYGKQNYNFKGNVLAYRDDVLVGEYRGIHEVAKILGVQATKVSACINGRRNKTGGYTFKRK